MEQSEKVAAISIAVNITLLSLKYIFAKISGSAGLAADAIHSSFDVLASLTVFAGLKISKRKSKRFPYGLYKVENFVSLILAFAILFAGYEIAKEAIFGSNGEKLRYIPLAIIAEIAVIAITLGFSIYAIRKGEEIGSPSVVADGKHVRTDMFSSVAVLVGLIGALFGYNLDRIAVFVVIIFIAHAGIDILIDAMRVLLDASLDFDSLDKVKTIILSEPFVKEINSLTGRNSGSYKFIEAEVVFNVTNLEKAHSISKKIEKSIKDEIPHVDNVLIHYEPVKKEIISFAIPLANEKGKVSRHFGEAPFFAIVKFKTKDKSFMESEIIPNPFISVEKGKGIKAAEFLINRDVDVILIKEEFDGKGPVYAFSNAEVEVNITDSENMETALTEQGYKLKGEINANNHTG
ncbi:cation diffusion facilitator family transporter [Candidatus Poribacteria bacterium]|nr:cation diffusion facilitator family transporter [Candidatus Poribacteria bacterium]